MSNAAITMDSLGKRYRLGKAVRYKALRDTIAEGVAGAVNTLRGRHRPTPDAEEVWALRNITAQIERGKVVGIIGRNGAGKSTLLKLLSRITEPTEGYARIYGRVGSLLEVGTGFHPELTGRENIFLNGAILGMRKAEIRRRFDDIVEFSEIEKFIDTPVKHYSNGMYVRLAFAVAVNLETEILLVDEVLAVGDAHFQKKCLDRILQIGRGGRTILFVSHNMAAVRHICQSAIVLDHGGVRAQGEVNHVVDQYLADVARNEDGAQGPLETDTYRVEAVTIRSLDGPVMKTFDPVEIKVRVQAKIDVVDPGLRIGIFTLEGHRLAGLDIRDFDLLEPMRAGESMEMGFRVDEFPLMPGVYEMDVLLRHVEEFKLEFVPKKFRFEVVQSPVYGVRGMESFVGNVGLRASTFHAAVPASAIAMNDVPRQASASAG